MCAHWQLPFIMRSPPGSPPSANLALLHCPSYPNFICFKLHNSERIQCCEFYFSHPVSVPHVHVICQVTLPNFRVSQLYPWLVCAVGEADISSWVCKIISYLCVFFFFPVFCYKLYEANPYQNRSTFLERGKLIPSPLISVSGCFVTSAVSRSSALKCVMDITFFATT